MDTIDDLMSDLTAELVTAEEKAELTTSAEDDMGTLLVQANADSDDSDKL